MRTNLCFERIVDFVYTAVLYLMRLCVIVNLVLYVFLYVPFLFSRWEKDA